MTGSSPGRAQKNLAGISTEISTNPSTRQQKEIDREKTRAEADRWLCPIDNETPDGPRGILPVDTDQYLDLVDWTGRLIKEGKGAIPDHLPPIWERLEIDMNRWLNTVQNYGGIFHRVVGKFDTMTASAQKAGKRWWKGVRACRQAFSPA